MTKMKKRHAARTALAVAAFGLTIVMAPMAWADAKTYTFDIPAENAAKALNDFSKQSGVELLFPYDAAVKINVPALKGTFTRDEALARILVDTGLEIASQTDTTISLRVIERQSAANPDEPTTEVIVTGSHIRGGNPTSPVHTVTRKEIDQSGYGQIGDLFRSLPENFSGGQNPGVIAASQSNIANLNATNASTVNLRGLGTDATLVLVNGHRLAADYGFQGADISGIPLSAVQRIEIVPDGASALYGSDAVAGVANIILRKNYDGTEISARVGGATQGGGFDQTYGVLTGQSGNNGYFLINLEFERQDAIRAGDRDFAATVPAATTLQQPQTRRSAFVAFGRSLGAGIDLAVDALVSDRDTTQTVQSSSLADPYSVWAYTPAYNVAATLDIDLPHDWRMHGTVGAAGSRNAITYNFSGSLSPSTFANYLQFAEVTADGTLATLPSGPVKIAVGGGGRQEGFQVGYKGEAGTITPSRDVTYVYAEAQAPLVTPSADRTGLHELELNLSARAEHYSDFGDTTNPKLGLRYVPFTDLTMRASWGKSFKAPSFQQLYSAYGLTLYKAPRLGYATTPADATGLLVYGGNPDLKPEKSTSWTFGGDYRPSKVPTLTLSATYFDIDYTDRVVQPINPRTQALSNPQFEPFVHRLPSVAELNALIARANYFDNFAVAPYDPAKVVAVVFNNYQNATAQTARGIDLAYRQAFEINSGTLTATGNATWLKLRQQTIITQPVAELSGTIYNPPEFKARGGLTWQKAGLSATATVNYVAGETDTGLTPNREIASWTTVDGVISYAFDTAGTAQGTRVSLAVSNLFDRDPPRASSPALVYEGLAFDSTNTSLIGRFVSLSVTKAW